MVRQRLSIACNVFIAVFTVVALVMMLSGWGTVTNPEVHLEAEGLENLKFFTVLSNLLAGIASAVYAWMLVRMPHDNRPVPHVVATLKLAGATSVGLTFLTVVVLFSIIWGLDGMFLGANFWFHLVLPIASIVALCILDTRLGLRLRDALVATLPMIIYGLAYYANILVNGMGEGSTSNDWYGLASAGLQWAPVVFAIMFVTTLLLAFALYAANRLMHETHETGETGDR